MSKRKNKFDVQVVWDDGGSYREQSRTDVELSRADVIGILKAIIARVEARENRERATVTTTAR